MNANVVKRVICRCLALGCALDAAAWTVDGSGVATIESGETKVINTTNDFIVGGSRISRISLSANSLIEFADGFVSGNWLTFGGSGGIRFGTSTFNTYYVDSGSPLANILNGGTVTFDGPITAPTATAGFRCATRARWAAWCFSTRTETSSPSSGSSAA